MTKALRRNRACCFNRCVADTHRHSMKCWRLPHYLIRPLHKFNILYFLGIKDLFEFVSGGAAARILDRGPCGDEEKITKLLGMNKMYKICGGGGINTKLCPLPPPIIRYPLINAIYPSYLTSASSHICKYAKIVTDLYNCT